MLMGTVIRRRKAETRALLLHAGLSVLAERGIELGTLDDVAEAAGFTKGAIYRQFPSKGAFLLAVFEHYAAVALAGAGARQASWFIPLTLQFAAHAMRDPLLRRRFAVVLAEAPDGATADGQLLMALARVLPPAPPPPPPPSPPKNVEA
jgi:AcrR family transcriptional regulator